MRAAIEQYIAAREAYVAVHSRGQAIFGPQMEGAPRCGREELARERAAWGQFYGEAKLQRAYYQAAEALYGLARELASTHTVARATMELGCGFVDAAEWLAEAYCLAQKGRGQVLIDEFRA